MIFRGCGSHSRALLARREPRIPSWPVAVRTLALAVAGAVVALDKRPLADPVSVSSDGLLLDGHQRLKAQLANGRTEIGADEVHVIAEANAANAYEWALRLNVQRRHLTA